MRNFSILLISLFFLSCQQKENKQTANKSLDVNHKEKKIEQQKEQNKQIDDTIAMNFKNQEGFYIAEGSIDSIDSRVYLKFNNEIFKQLDAKIVPTTGKGNIRFNQIIFPDKTSDGPFGMDLKIDLKQKGNYIIVIGHSLMADNPFYGKFKVQLDAKK
ncbi:hypothetical protein J3S90_02095 [Flavobacterium sp. P4023]|uniref:Lipoprotein n=1 Tax=Flavobacterium flabelliforme TaxID=2816119 RepID=A0ABS5CPN6_9FLAO|nr:hypothetical protein [Flavobacterium flabelliforme]MBP4140587.1 hypothetical protein [Flavobacterium flabelliforme]